ncbi:MAG: MerR family transcriptional regulator [Acidobacteriota bacterium]|nr:MAG: MerR family transcriptional regulator [Acidobacteriota bacterium]
MAHDSEQNQPPCVACLTLAQVARLLELSVDRIRVLIRAGLVKPARDVSGYRFSLQDIVLLRTAKSLLTAGVSARRVRRNLESLRRQLPPGRPLSGVRIWAVGNQIYASDGDSMWEPESGQILFNFQVDELAAEVARANIAWDEQA